MGRGQSCRGRAATGRSRPYTTHMGSATRHATSMTTAPSHDSDTSGPSTSMAAASSDPNGTGTSSSTHDSAELLPPGVHPADFGLEDFIAVVRSIVSGECGAASDSSQASVSATQVTSGVTVSSPLPSTTITLSQAAAYSTSSLVVVSFVPITITHQPGLQLAVSTVSSTTVPLAPLPRSHPAGMGFNQSGMFVLTLSMIVFLCTCMCCGPMSQYMWL